MKSTLNFICRTAKRFIILGEREGRGMTEVRWCSETEKYQVRVHVLQGIEQDVWEGKSVHNASCCNVAAFLVMS